MNPENNYAQFREQDLRNVRRAAYGVLAVAGLAFLIRTGIDEVQAANPSCTSGLAVAAERTADFIIKIGDVSVTANNGEPIGDLAVAANCLDAELPRQFEEDPFVTLKRFGFRSPEAGRAVVTDEDGGRAGFSPWDEELKSTTVFNAQPHEVLVVYPDKDGWVLMSNLTGNYVRVTNQDKLVGWMHQGDLRKPVVK